MKTVETIEKVLEFSPNTLQAIERLAKITGAESGIGELIQDALRLMEWVVFQQANKKLVAALPASEAVIKFVKYTEGTEVLDRLFEEKAEEEAKRFFAQA